MNTNDTVFKRLAAIILVPTGLLAIGAITVVMAVRPFDVPEFKEIDTSESAFLIPLDDDTSKQLRFPSVDFLDQQKVAAKRIQIPHQWLRTGFLPNSGQYVPTVRLIKVDRKPVTREWTRQHSTGTSAKDEAVAAESKDSINFTMGVTCTANIPEDMAATFLYTYPSSSLADVMDHEIRARVQQVIAEAAGRLPFSEMIGQKSEIMDTLRKDVIPFFETRGVRITTVGMLGGLQFENPEIQKAIDESIKAQQLKTVAEAKRSAQEVENLRIQMEAKATAEAEILKADTLAKAQASKAKSEAEWKRHVAQLEAESEAIRVESQVKSRLKLAEAEAESQRKQAEARVSEAKLAAEANCGELLVRLRQVEMETQRWKTWDGKLPVLPSMLASYAGWVFPPLPQSPPAVSGVVINPPR